MEEGRNISDERARELTFRFTVQSVVFALHFLEAWGFHPTIDREARMFGITDSAGEELAGEEMDRMARAMVTIGRRAPLAIGVFHDRGEPTDAGVFAGGVLAEAFDIYEEERG